MLIFTSQYKYLKKYLLELKIRVQLMKCFINQYLLKILEIRWLIFLPKHKKDYDTNLKFCPIISSYNSYAFGLAKQMSDVLIIRLIQNKKGTLDFITKLRNLKITGNFKM